MNFSLLLIHSDAVPADAKEALRAANQAAPQRRGEHLRTAARALASGTELGESEVYDLICPQLARCA